MKTTFYYLCMIALLSLTACNGSKKLVSNSDTSTEPDKESVMQPAMDIIQVESAGVMVMVVEEINFLFPTVVNGREEMIKHKVIGQKTERISGSKTVIDVVVEDTNQSFTVEKKEVAGTEQLVWIGGDPPANPR